MSITQALCTSFKSEILQGIHSSSDTYKIALFTSAAALDATITAYGVGGAAANEVTGTGYTAGGVALAGYSATTSGTTAMLDWSTNPSWPSSTITCAGALIYNATKSNKAVAVLSFGGNQSDTNGTFTAQFPTPGAGTSLIRLP